MQVMFLVCGSIRMMIKDPSSTHNLGGDQTRQRYCLGGGFKYFLFSPLFGE